jgi:uncharacterized protein
MKIIVDSSRSPHAQLRPISVADVTLTDSFWAPRIETNRAVTLPSQHEHLETTGRVDNFRRASGRKTGLEFQGDWFFNDSDVYKWLEAASWELACRPNSELDALCDSVIDEIDAAQQPDGYLNTYFMFEREKERWQNTRDLHEMYCAGHFIQAAVAHYRATGKNSALEIARKLADHIDRQFPAEKPGACGHEECELALVELYRVTSAQKYLELAQRMIDARGQKPALCGGGRYWQDHQPFVEQKEVTGHAVRMLYLCSGATDVVLETGNPAYRAALDAIFENFVTRRIYVTGGAGSRYEGEAFGSDWELTSERAYTETCAAIGSVMWCWRMLLLTGEAKFADLIEHTLYNAVLPGLSEDGREYFYQNPLADRGTHRRQAWFGCACCPPNVARLLAQLPGYFAATDDAGRVYLTLYAQGEITVGHTKIKITGEYPWDGTLTIEATGDAPALMLRIPGWATHTGSRSAPSAPSSGGNLDGWREVPLTDGKATVTLDFPMEPRRIVAEGRALALRGQVALARGPLVYCVEQADHEKADVWDLALPDDAPLSLEKQGKWVALRARGLARTDQALYSAPNPGSQTLTPTPITAIPYFAWASRTPGPMTVWLQRA